MKKYNVMRKSLVTIAVVLTVVPFFLVGCSASRDAASGKSSRGTYGSYYGTMSEDERTSSISKIETSSKEMVTYANMYDYLRGRVPGVQVSPDGSIIIRGVSTNSGQTDPLILVDGVEVTSLDGIDPANVQSVEVLKDGTSAMYGARGQNGVILITTRH